MLTSFRITPSNLKFAAQLSHESLNKTTNFSVFRAWRTDIFRAAALDELVLPKEHIPAPKQKSSRAVAFERQVEETFFSRWPGQRAALGIHVRTCDSRDAPPFARVYEDAWRTFMLRLFRAKKAPEDSRSSVPDGLRIYAIGDVHGRLDLLEELLDRIARDSAARASAESHLVFLGDLIDRGPDSAAIVERLIESPPGFAQCHFIMGNHEEALIDSTRGPGKGRADWLSYGGQETLQSYGISPGTIAAGGMVLEQELHSKIPERHIDFFAGFHDNIRIGDYLFVHAGIRPGVPIEHQTSADMRWIREEFLEDDSDHGVVVVHGHTISEAPEMRTNRIGIDTGAYRSGVLTALGLEGTERWLLATGSQRPSVSV